MNNEVYFSEVEVVDANELAKYVSQNAPKEQIPAGITFDGVHCVDCDLEIEPQRLAILATCRCGECKMWHDKEQARSALNGNPLYEEE